MKFNDMTTTDVRKSIEEIGYSSVKYRKIF